MNESDYSRGFLFNEDDEVVELCSAYKIQEDKGQLAIKALEEISATLFSSGPHYETIEKIIKIIDEYDKNSKGNRN